MLRLCVTLRVAERELDAVDFKNDILKDFSYFREDLVLSFVVVAAGFCFQLFIICFCFAFLSSTYFVVSFVFFVIIFQIDKQTH